MDDRNYSVIELVHNQSFRRMCKGTARPEEIENWSRWMEDRDENRERAKKALSEIAGFEFADLETPDFEKEWSRLYKTTVGRQDMYSIGTAHKDSALRWIYRVAAALLLIGMVGIGAYLYSENGMSRTQLEQITQEETVKTGEGQQKTLKFNNGSKVAKVVLNSNSTLTYNVGLIRDQAIGVTLQGEAFFDVEKDFSKNHPAFSVSTPDGIIEDIGTEFLVTVENERSRVVLQEGMVNVKATDGEKAQKEFKVSMGEMVEFSKTNILKKETVNSTFYTSWATGSMQFDQTKISTFAEYVEQRFRVAVVADPALTGVTLDGAVYFKSLEGLVRSVSDVTRIPVYQSKNRDTVYIGNPYNSNNK